MKLAVLLERDCEPLRAPLHGSHSMQGPFHSHKDELHELSYNLSLFSTYLIAPTIVRKLPRRVVNGVVFIYAIK